MKNPKQILLSIAIVAVAATVVSVRADDKHDHKDHEHAEKVAGPNGGRLITSVEPHLEFLVMKDRKVQITAVADNHKPIAIGKQTVKVTGGDRSNPTKMKFKKQGNVLISDIAFPAGNDFPVVVQIKTSATAKKVYERFNLDLNPCPTCKKSEYACICDHDDHGHDHKDGDHDHKKKD